MSLLSSGYVLDWSGLHGDPTVDLISHFLGTGCLFEHVDNDDHDHMKQARHSRHTHDVKCVHLHDKSSRHCSLSDFGDNTFKLRTPMQLIVLDEPMFQHEDFQCEHPKMQPGNVTHIDSLM